MNKRLFLKSTKILITGSSGFVGKHLVQKLLPKYKIVKYDLKIGRDILNERLLLEKLKGVDIVIHLAAFISAEESWNKPKEYFLNNSLGTLSVVKNSVKAGVKKFIYFSSAAVKAKPLTPYALSKKYGEDFVKLFSKDLDYSIVSPENIYGPGQNQSYGYVIHNFIRNIKGNLPISIYGDGLQVRDFIYIDDVVSVTERLVESRVSGNTLSLGTGKGTNIRQLSRLVREIMKKSVEVRFLPARIEPQRSVADIKALSNIGIETDKFLNIKQGIKKLIDTEYSD